MHLARKTTLLVLTTGVVVCILTGCQILDQLGLGNPTSTLNAEIPTVQPTDDLNQPTPVPGGNPGEILIWLPPQFDPEQKTLAGELLKARFDSFEQQNPGGKVNVRIKNLEGRGGLLDSLTTTNSAAPGALPSLVLLSSSDFEIAALKGLVFPVSIYSSKTIETDWFLFANEISTIQGVQYCTPFAGDPLVMVYDSRQLAFPPKMWEGIKNQPSTIAFPANDPSGLLSLDMYLSAGGTFEDKDGNFSLQETELNRVNQVLFNGASSGVFPNWISDFSSFEQSFNAFSDGTADLAIAWLSVALKNQNQYTVITSVPAFSASHSTITNGWLLCVSNPALETELPTIKLAEYLTEPVFQQEWSEAAGLLPVRKSALNNWKDQNLSAVLFSIAESARPIPANEIIAKTGSIFQETMVSLLKQQISVSQATVQILQKIYGQN